MNLTLKRYSYHLNNYYYTIENSSFNVSPERTAGTYSKYASIDDKMDDLKHILKVSHCLKTLRKLSISNLF